MVLGRDGREPQRAAREAVHGEPERVAAYLRSATERAATDASVLGLRLRGGVGLGAPHLLLMLTMGGGTGCECDAAEEEMKIMVVCLVGFIQMVACGC